MYVLSGILPIEAQIQIKVLIFYCNICHQDENSLEKRLARRQLTVKDMNSHSWFIDVQKFIIKFDLGDALDWLDKGIKKSIRIKQIKKGIETCWTESIKTNATLYFGLRYLNSRNFRPGKVHGLLKHKCQSVSGRCDKDTNQTQNSDWNIHTSTLKI